MTFTLPPGSPKALKAQVFGRELVRACRARDVGLNELARSIGIGHTALDHYRTGSVLPKTATAHAMAEVLDWPRLAEIIELARTFICDRPGCERTYRHEGGGPRKYCSTDCVRLAETQRMASRRIRQVAHKDDGRLRAAAIAQLRSATRIADERAMAAEIAIGAYCNGCEPEGLCRMAECPLRAFSPLPLVTHAVARRPLTNAEIRVESARKAAPKRSVAMTRYWSDPAKRTAQSERSRAWHGSRTPEEHEAWVRSATEGQRARPPRDRAAAAQKAWATRRAREATQA